MGVSLVGQGAVQEVQYPVVLRNVSVVSSPTTSTASMYTAGVFVPKGTYSVHIQIEGVGNPSGSSISGAGYTFLEDLLASIATIEADTGRPGPVLATSGPFKQTLILNKDSYVYATINSSSSTALQNLKPDIILTPKKPNYVALPTITANRTTTASTNSTTGSISDVNVGFITTGWDYDNNYPFIVVGASNAAVSYSYTIVPNITIFRFNPSTGKWTNKVWTSNSLAAGSTWFTGFSGPAIWGASPVFQQLFIKSNFFHCLNMQGMLVDSSSNRWGWIKADLSSAGSALTWQPGHTNTAFCEASSNIGSGNDNRMIYFWDKISHKVIYNGCKNITFNGTWSQYGWRHKWGQWDIATDTVDYQLSNGVIDPRTAGSSADSNAGWNSATPSAADGNSYAIVINGTSEYLARFNRNGTYTGVGTMTAHYPFTPTSQTGLSNSSQFNSLEYLPGNYARWGSSPGNITREYNISSGTSYYQPDSNNNPGNRLVRNTVYYQLSIGGGPYINGFITNEWIVVAVVSYGRYTNQTGRYTIPVTLYIAPATESNIAQALSMPGGITSATYGNTGINNGTW